MNRIVSKLSLSLFLPLSALVFIAQGQDDAPKTWEERARERFAPLTAEQKKEISAAQPIHSGLDEKILKPFRILVFYRCEAFIHTSIPTANFALQEMGRKTKAFSVELSDDYSDFSKANLKKYDAIVFNSSSSPMLDDDKREAILNFIKDGKGIVGVHMATDFKDWEEGTAMMGGRWNGHPWTKEGNWAFKLDDPAHKLNAAFGNSGFWFVDEIYQYKPESYQGEDKLRILVSLDMSKKPVTDAMEVEKYLKYKETYGEGPREVPVSWIREYGKGRLFYTNFGHNEATYSDPVIMQHLYDGILYALGYTKWDATPTSKSYEIEAAIAPEN